VSTTHDSLRTGIAAVVAGLTVGGIALTVSQSTDAADMYATEQLGRRVCVALEDAPGEEYGRVRTYYAVLSAAHMRGCDEVAARSSLSTLARALRTAILAPTALASYEAQVVDADSDDITRDGDAIILRQRYQILAVP